MMYDPITNITIDDIDYDLNEENEKRIIGILKEKNGIDEFDEGMDLKDIIDAHSNTFELAQDLFF